MRERITNDGEGLLVYVQNPKFKEFIVKTRTDPPISRSVMIVQGLSAFKAAERYSKKAKESTGLKKVYYTQKAKLSNKWYIQCLKAVKKDLTSDKRCGLCKELTLHCLDVFKRKGGYIPVEILAKMAELPRLDWDDEEKVGQLWKEYCGK